MMCNKLFMTKVLAKNEVCHFRILLYSLGTIGIEIKYTTTLSDFYNKIINGFNVVGCKYSLLVYFSFMCLRELSDMHVCISIQSVILLWLELVLRFRA